MGIHGYYHTLTHKGTVFTGTGTGMGKNTRGLPMSFPTYPFQNMLLLLCRLRWRHGWKGEQQVRQRQL
jgi:hypothetical protein